MSLCPLTDLQSLPLFHGLSPAELEIIQSRSSVKSCRVDTVLLRVSKYGGKVYLLLRGRVKVFVQGHDGLLSTLAICGAGELLGEISAIDGQNPSANVVAIEPCTVLVMERVDFLHCMRTMPLLSFGVAEVLARRARLATAQISTLSTMDIRTRLARQLLTLADGEDEKGQRAIGIQLTQSELAEMVGSSRAQVNRILMGFKREGVLDQGRKGLRILKPSILETMSKISILLLLMDGTVELLQFVAG